MDQVRRGKEKVKRMLGGVYLQHIYFKKYCVGNVYNEIKKYIPRQGEEIIRELYGKVYTTQWKDKDLEEWFRVYNWYHSNPYKGFGMVPLYTGCGNHEDALIWKQQKREIHWETIQSINNIQNMGVIERNGIT